jgi:pyrroline-5-carboxylate reductase
MDAVTAVSGSGPAYVFYFIEALRDAAREPSASTRDQARQLAIETVVGAAALAAESANEDVSLLRQRVTSKGGTTEAALNSLDADRVKAAFVRAIRAAEARGRELGEMLGKD